MMCSLLEVPRRRCKLVEALGGTVVGIAVLLELEALQGRERLQGRRVESLLRL